MTGKNKKRKFLSKEEMLAVVLISAVHLFSSFTLSENGAGEENAGTDWVFLFSIVALAAVLVFVTNAIITYIPPEMRESTEENK